MQLLPSLCRELLWGCPPNSLVSTKRECGQRSSPNKAATHLRAMSKKHLCCNPLLSLGSHDKIIAVHWFTSSASPCCAMPLSAVNQEASANMPLQGSPFPITLILASKRLPKLLFFNREVQANQENLSTGKSISLPLVQKSCVGEMCKSRSRSMLWEPSHCSSEGKLQGQCWSGQQQVCGTSEIIELVAAADQQRGAIDFRSKSFMSDPISNQQACLLCERSESVLPRSLRSGESMWL